MKKALLLLAAILFTSSLFAQTGTIKGKVIDIKSGNPMGDAKIVVTGTGKETTSDNKGNFQILNLSAGKYELKCLYPGYDTLTVNNVFVKENSTTNIIFKLTIGEILVEEVEYFDYEYPPQSKSNKIRGGRSDEALFYMPPPSPQNWNTEEYDRITETGFKNVTAEPLSTFSIDVDAASYSNARRFITEGQMPYKDAVRIEEFINYFDYNYPEPEGDDPIAVYLEYSKCPWNKEANLVHIGLQSRKILSDEKPKQNLVFLLDVSGSMSDQNKLPLVKKAFKLLVSRLDENDYVSIVVYAGAAGVILEPTKGSDKETIISALERLQAGGSTAGGAGIRRAYDLAMEHFIKGGNNRVILATDGDFNIGVSSTSELDRLIEEKRETGIFLTTLGFGMGNYKDNRMEILADKGNGNAYYIDGVLEARKVFVNRLNATLFTVAKDVKLQVEFNPKNVKSYRLVGYENRRLENEDFDNDKKDAGELGSGHTVTALYEIIPADGTKRETDLKYQGERTPKKDYEDEILTVKIRYKEPDGDKSKLMSKVLYNDIENINETSENFRFAAAAAEFAMLLRDSEFKGSSSYDGVVKLAEGAKGEDKYGYRDEFLFLVKSVRNMIESGTR